MPGQLLYDWLPLYSSMRAYARFGVIVALAAAVLMALAWQLFLRRDRFRRHAPFLATLALVVLLADIWTPPYTWGSSRVEPTETARFLAAAPPGLVMQMPLEASQSGPAHWQGQYYKKPIAYGFDTFEPPEWAPVRPALEDFPSDACLDVLRSWGVRYMVGEPVADVEEAPRPSSVSTTVLWVAVALTVVTGVQYVVAGSRSATTAGHL